MKKQIAILALTLVGAASAVQAEGFMPWTDVMMQADTNHDGALTMAEVKNYKASDHFIGFQPFMADHFQDYDTNGDGKVSMAELKAGTIRDQMTDPEVSVAFFKGLGFMPRNQ